MLLWIVWISPMDVVAQILLSKQRNTRARGEVVLGGQLTVEMPLTFDQGNIFPTRSHQWRSCNWRIQPERSHLHWLVSATTEFLLGPACANGESGAAFFPSIQGSSTAGVSTEIGSDCHTESAGFFTFGKALGKVFHRAREAKLQDTATMTLKQNSWPSDACFNCEPSQKQCSKEKLCGKIAFQK